MNRFLLIGLCSFLLCSCLSEEERNEQNRRNMMDEIHKKEMEDKYVGKIIKFSGREYIVDSYQSCNDEFRLMTPRTFVNNYDLYVSEKQLINLIKNSDEK